jgi:hypothetical protein
LVFAGYPDFRPNRTPKEVLQAGAFGGTYFRRIRSGVTGQTYEGDWRELPADWFEGLKPAQVAYTHTHREVYAHAHTHTHSHTHSHTHTHTLTHTVTHTHTHTHTCTCRRTAIPLPGCVEVMCVSQSARGCGA